MDQYYISDTAQRSLMAQHFHSSLDEPNLDNVEAKLYVARQKNHQLAMQYFKNKYGSTAVYQEFVQTHNLGEIDLVQSKEQELRRHLDRKALEIATKFKSNAEAGLKTSTISVEEDDINKPLLKNNRPASKGRAANNPWTQSNKKTAARTQVKAQEEDRVIDHVSDYQNHKASEFIGEFKSYLMNKEKQKQERNMMETNNSKLGRSLESNPSIKVSQQVPKQEEKKKNYEEELAKKIFREILGSSFSEQKTVEKIALIQYLSKNRKILKVLGLSEQDLNRQLMGQSSTQFEAHISYEQFLFFILRTVGKQKEINQFKQRNRDKSLPQGCMLSQEILNRFEALFKKLDTHTDLIVKRMEYIDMLANDPIIKKQLNSGAVYEEDLDKRVSLRRIFQRIQIQLLFGSEEEKKVREYISWNEFIDYLRSQSKDRSKYDLMLLIDTIRREDKFGLVEVPEIVINIIMESCRKVNRVYQEYYNTIEVLQAICRHPEYDHERYTLVRQESRISGLPSETFEEVLGRIKQSAQQYLTIKEFLQYFSARGTPIEAFELARANSARKNFSGVKVKFAEENIMEKNDNPDGYDSDPEMYNSQLMKDQKTSPRKSARSSKKIGSGLSFYEEGKQAKMNKRQFKVTVPIPFSFEEREKSRTKNRSLQQEEEKLSPFKAKQIPSSVLDVGRYQRQIEEDKRKIEERKKNSMIITLASERPFSFIDRKAKKKTKQQREQFAFKAKPIPWYCSVQLLNKKKQAEIVRNQKIAKEAQESLAKAKLPPRMERDYQQKVAQNAIAEDSKNKKSPEKHFVYRDPPDFNRLHREFEEGMERKRKQNKTTKPREFNFSQKEPSRPKTTVNENLGLITQQSFLKGLDDSRYKKILEPKEAAGTTLKFQQQAQKRRKQMQGKKKQEEKKMIEEEQRKKIDEQLKKKVVSLAKNKENKEEQQRKKRQQQMRQQQQNFQKWKKQCVQKGRNQPMLVERPLKRDEKIEKMRKLYQISQTLKSNGIKGRDHDSYFKREQLLLLQDWQLLKDKL